jgi:hypothetical protein
MGTRSAIGFRMNGKDALMYCNSDGYPTSMGKNVYNQIKGMIREWGIDGIKDSVRHLRKVSQTKKATKKDLTLFQHLHQQFPDGVTYYDLLRDLQGDLVSVLHEGIMPVQNIFIKDSLFCEWAYIFNLDDMTLEIYKGFQKTRPKKSRYRMSKPREGYYACELVGTTHLSEVDQFFNAFVIDDNYWATLEGD